MNRSILRHAAAALSCVAFALPALPAWAASSAVASVSDSVSTSIASLSNSLRRSSDSSSRRDVAQGDYRIVEIAAVADDPALVRIELQPAADDDVAARLQLRLPRALVEHHALAAGQVLSARTRPYGVEFVHAARGRAVVLLLDDDWVRDLRSVALTL